MIIHKAREVAEKAVALDPAFVHQLASRLGLIFLRRPTTRHLLRSRPGAGRLTPISPKC